MHCKYVVLQDPQALTTYHYHYGCFLISLTDTVEGLQEHMEELHTQMEELQAAQVERANRQLTDPRRTLGAQSVSCLKELYNLHQERCVCVCVSVRVCVRVHACTCACACTCVCVPCTRLGALDYDRQLISSSKSFSNIIVIIVMVTNNNN